MSIDEYFHKTLFISIIIAGPALTMSLLFVYWVQYKGLMLFPSFLYYVVATGSLSIILYFLLFIVPENCGKQKGKNKPEEPILLLPPPHTPIEEIQNAAEPIIYKEVEEVPQILSPVVPEAAMKVQQEETAMYKKLYYAFIDRHVKGYMSEEDAQTLLDNIYRAIDNRSINLIMEGHKIRLPYEVKPTSNFTSLNTEDIYHIGFVVKFFLKKRNDYGAAFIKEAFPHQLKDVEFSTVATKLTSSESKNLSIPIPEVCWGANRNISKKFCGRITEELIKQI